MQKRESRNIAVGIILGAFFALMLFLNFHTFLTADDFMFTLHRLLFRRIESIPDIVDSLKTLRHDVNGRVIAHFFAHLFLFWPKWIFNFVNAGCSTLLFYILYRYVRSGEKTRDALLLLFLLAAEWLLLPAFGQVFLWLTGACNYSWTMVFSFLFLYPFFTHYMQRPQPVRSRAGDVVLRILYLGLAFLAGAYSENGALAMLCAAFCLLALSWLRKKKLAPFLLLGFLTACGGFLFLMLSPSELNGRRGEVSESTLTKAARLIWARLSGHVPTALLIAAALIALAALAGLIWLLLRKRRLGCRLCALAVILFTLAGLVFLAPEGLTVRNFASGISLFLADTKELLLLAAALYLLLLLRALEAGVERRTLLAALVLGLSALASVAVFLFAVYFPARSACPFITYTGLADALLLSGLWEKGARKPLRLLAPSLTLGMLLVLPLAVGDISLTYRQALERDAYLRWAELNRPGEVIVVDPVTPQTKYSACWPGDEDYFNGEISVYYNINWFEVSEYVN